MHAKFAYFKVSRELFHKIRREELFVKKFLKLQSNRPRFLQFDSFRRQEHEVKRS